MSDVEIVLPLKKRVERIFTRTALRIVVTITRLLSMSSARRLGECMGMVLYLTQKRYRRVAMKNLNLVYGSEIDEAERKKMTKDVFVHFGRMALEFLKLPALSLDELDRMVKVQGESHLKAALEAGNGGLIITGHFGNWEVIARWLALHGYKMSVIARRANDPVADKLLQGTRQDGGTQVYLRGNSVKAVLQCLKRGELVGILPDQNAGDITAPFFGMPTGTTNGPAVIHLRTGAPIIFTWCSVGDDGQFYLQFEEPVVVPSSGNKEADEVSVMTLVNAHLEAQIRSQPTQWLWLHDRWRASPHVFEMVDSKKV